MLRLLRRIGPRSPVLAMLFWVVAALAALTALFTAFYFLDRYLPGGGMF